MKRNEMAEVASALGWQGLVAKMALAWHQDAHSRGRRTDADLAAGIALATPVVGALATIAKGGHRSEWSPLARLVGSVFVGIGVAQALRASALDSPSSP